MGVIILSVEISFSEWLQKEIEKRGWSWNKLAENAGLSSGTIYNIRDGTRGVGESSLKAIAYALRLPVDQVFRVAGFLPSVTISDENVEELIFLYNQLSVDDKEEILELMKFKAERKQQAQTSKSTTKSIHKKDLAGNPLNK